MRGNRIRKRGLAGVRGSIPACAGEPPERGAGSRMVAVYPRVCGGTAAAMTLPLGVEGLSPRVRGNHHSRTAPPDAGGSIPACAGEPMGGGIMAGQGRVYPRVCGGTRWTHRTRGGGRGLSPRVRGNRGETAPAARRRRSIPACAGEPPNLSPGYAHREVYPRVCGGTPAEKHQQSGKGGLSPRVRGNQNCPLPPIDKPGSIPACAGEP